MIDWLTDNKDIDILTDNKKNKSEHRKSFFGAVRNIDYAKAK